VNTATGNPVVFLPQRDYGPPRLTPAEITDIHDMLAPVTAVMNADGMTAGGFTVTAGPNGLTVSRPDRVDDHSAQAKLKFARDVLRGRLIAAGTLWLVPADTLLCLLHATDSHPSTYRGLAVSLFDDGQPGKLIDACGYSDAHVELLPLPGTD
jgi:hypothetical protein